jgi:cytidylate kinase
VIISGLTASGKTTHAHIIAGEFGLRYVSASQILLHRQRLAPYQAPNYWVTSQSVSRWDATDQAYVDAELLQLEKDGSPTVFDCLSLAWMRQQAAFTVWLQCSELARVQRARLSHFTESGLPLQDGSELATAIRLKDENMKEFLRTGYGVDTSNLSMFNLVMDTTALTETGSRGRAREGILRAQKIISDCYLAWRNGDSCKDLIARDEPLVISVQWNPDRPGSGNGN